MVSRRNFLAGSGGLAALSLGQSAGLAWSTPMDAAAEKPSLFLYDRLIPEADGLIDIVRRDTVPIASMLGDIGTAWMAHLEPMWREQPRAVAGVTFGGALFCLEQLGRSYGLACTFSAMAKKPGDLGPALLAALRARDVPSVQSSRLSAIAADQPVVWLMQTRLGAQG